MKPKLTPFQKIIFKYLPFSCVKGFWNILYLQGGSFNPPYKIKWVRRLKFREYFMTFKQYTPAIVLFGYKVYYSEFYDGIRYIFTHDNLEPDMYVSWSRINYLIALVKKVK